MNQARSERAKMAKDYAELLKKHKALEKMHFNWNPECLKGEINNLAQILKNETDHGTNENFVTNFTDLMMKG